MSVDRLLLKVKKVSDDGPSEDGRPTFTFKDRLLFADGYEVRYYSKVGLCHEAPANFSRNSFESIQGLPKCGIPVALVTLQFPPEKWLVEKKVNFGLKVIFPQDCQMTYKKGANIMNEFYRFNKQGQKVSYFEQKEVFQGRLR